MKKENSKNNIVSQAFKIGNKKYIVLSLPLLFFALLTIAMLGLGYVFPATLILSIPFIIIPSFFSISAINAIADNKNAHEVMGFFVMFRAYFSQIFRGGYKIWFGVLKAVITFTIVSFVSAFILVNTLLINDSSFVDFFNSINSITDPEETFNLLIDFFSNNDLFNKTVYLEFVISFLFGSYAFVHHFSFNALKYNYNFYVALPLPMHDLNIIFKEVYKKNKREMQKEYLKCYWFLAVLFFVGFIGGGCFSFFLLPGVDFAQASVIGLFGSFILLIFFIPYYLNASNLIFGKYKAKCFETFIDLSKQSLKELKDAKEISEEKEKEVLEMLESQAKKEKKDNEEK